jgi:hypothetical protein
MVIAALKVYGESAAAGYLHRRHSNFSAFLNRFGYGRLNVLH